VDIDDRVRRHPLRSGHTDDGLYSCCLGKDCHSCCIGNGWKGSFCCCGGCDTGGGTDIGPGGGDTGCDMGCDTDGGCSCRSWLVKGEESDECREMDHDDDVVVDDDTDDGHC